MNLPQMIPIQQKVAQTGTYVLAEGIPEELDHEWRFLHPFEIPGGRFPTDATPRNQRRLANNDAFVELDTDYRIP